MFLKGASEAEMAPGGQNFTWVLVDSDESPFARDTKEGEHQGHAKVWQLCLRRLASTSNLIVKSTGDMRTGVERLDRKGKTGTRLAGR